MAFSKIRQDKSGIMFRSTLKCQMISLIKFDALSLHSDQYGPVEPRLERKEKKTDNYYFGTRQ